jgi:cytoskeletal protein CcmA (bactofilin family)
MLGKSQSSKGDSKLSSPMEEISAFLGKETVFEGKMTFEGVFRLDGKFEGEIFESGTLIVGKQQSSKERLVSIRSSSMAKWREKCMPKGGGNPF